MAPKVAVIGCGNMGSKHAKALDKLNMLHEVVDPIQNRVVGLAKQYNVLGLGTTADITSDIVVVATPPDTHYDLAKKYIEQGKHVLVEKPFTATLQQATDLRKLAQKHKVHVACNFIERFNPAFLDIQIALTGNDEQPDAYFARYSSMFDKDGMRKPEPNTIYERPLWNLACHDIDLACRLFEKATVMSARQFAYPFGGVQIELQHTSGVNSVINTMHHVGPDVRSIIIETKPTLAANLLEKESNSHHKVPLKDQLEAMWIDFWNTVCTAPTKHEELDRAIYNVELLETISEKIYCEACLGRSNDDCSC